MKTIFKCLDSNKKGYIEKDDLVRLAERFEHHGKLTDDKKERFRSKLGMWWNQNFAEGEKLSSDQFVSSRYEINRTTCAQDALVHFKGNLELMFDSIDTDGNGAISLDKWKVFHLAMGVHDDEMTPKAFEIVDIDKDGKISLNEFITAAFDFFYNQDDSVYKEFLGAVDPL